MSMYIGLSSRICSACNARQKQPKFQVVFCILCLSFKLEKLISVNKDSKTIKKVDKTVEFLLCICPTI